MYGEFPELKAAVQWFISLMPEGDWSARRLATAKWYYETLINQSGDPSGKGRFYNERDLIGWYLFLGEAFTDHPWNYELIFGCHVVPILAAIGRNLDLLKSVAGFTERCRRIVLGERSQPNGGLFEILVAAAYTRQGWTVAFQPEQPGRVKTHDLNISKGKNKYAVECKRMEGGEYVEQERARMRVLWRQPCMFLVGQEISALLDVRFKVELKNVPDSYLLKKAQDFVYYRNERFAWDDGVSVGCLSRLDLQPIQTVLATDYIPHPSSRFNELLTGSYRRYDSGIMVMRLKFGPSPHLVDQLDLAVAARYESLSEAAIDRKARDILAKLSEANAQLPEDLPGIVHIGFEALSGDEVEQRRYEKILQRIRGFDRQHSALEYVYCHYFAPEPPPDETWAIDETCQWHAVRPSPQPLAGGLLVVPSTAGESRKGVHWDGKNLR